jgi:hypothetical protein
LHDESLRFAVVYEAAADFQTATELADRAIVEAVSWLDEEAIGGQREWFGALPNSQALTWKNIKLLARDENIRAHGHFGGKPGEPDAAAARRAILLLQRKFPGLAAIVLIRDQDDDPRRLTGLEQAREQLHSGPLIVIGLAIVERESWVVSGFEPENDKESSKLQAECQRLKFDPRSKSHELSAHKQDSALLSPKRALKELSGDNRERESRCWRETGLQALRERGAANGLAAYLSEVQDNLAPLIGHVSRH